MILRNVAKFYDKKVLETELSRVITVKHVCFFIYAGNVCTIAINVVIEGVTVMHA